MAEVSIIICAHNAEKTIDRAINSALAQTFADIEVVVVDDGSADATGARVKRLAASDARVRLISHDENRQLFEARRTGFFASSGRFVTFLDVDDMLRPNMVEMCLDVAYRYGDESIIVHPSICTQYIGAFPADVQQAHRAMFRAFSGELIGDDITHGAYRDFQYTWNICGKLFSRGLFESAYAVIPPVRLFELEDAVLFFAISHFAQRYVGLPDDYGLDYWLDAGGSIEFDNLSKVGIAFDVMREVADRLDVRLRYWDDLETTKRRELMRIAQTLLEFDDPKARVWGYKATIQHVSAFDFDCALSAACVRGDWRIRVGLSAEEIDGERTRAVLKSIESCEDEERYPELLAYLAELHPTFNEQFELLKRVGTTLFAGRDNDAESKVESVAQYYYKSGDGGVERVMTDLSALFASMGIQSAVVTAGRTDDEPYAMDESVTRTSIAEFGNNSRNLFTISDHLKKLSYFLRRTNTALYVYHAWLSAQCVWDLLLCKLMGIRFVLVIHGVFSFPLTLSIPERACFYTVPYLAALSDAVVCLTEVNRSFYQLFNSNTFVVPNPLPATVRALAQDQASGSNRSGQAPTVLWIGRFDQSKRPEDALVVLQRILSKVPDVRLVLVGKSADGAYEHRLKAHAKQLGVLDAVEFAGYAEQVASYYEQADLMLMTTEIEGYPMVLLEAAATGTPVVMYDLPYLDTDSCQGWIETAPLRDTEELARKAEAVLIDPTARERMSKEANAFAVRLLQFDYRAAWNDVFSCGRRSANVLERGADNEALMWSTMFEHDSWGTEKMQRAIGQSKSLAGKAEQEMRAEFESSVTWRIGRLVTALPRKVLGCFRGRNKSLG